MINVTIAETFVVLTSHDLFSDFYAQVRQVRVYNELGVHIHPEAMSSVLTHGMEKQATILWQQRECAYTWRERDAMGMFGERVVGPFCIRTQWCLLPPPDDDYMVSAPRTEDLPPLDPAIFADERELDLVS